MRSRQQYLLDDINFFRLHFLKIGDKTEKERSTNYQSLSSNACRFDKINAKTGQTYLIEEKLMKSETNFREISSGLKKCILGNLIVQFYSDDAILQLNETPNCYRLLI